MTASRLTARFFYAIMKQKLEQDLNLQIANEDSPYYLDKEQAAMKEAKAKTQQVSSN